MKRTLILLLFCNFLLILVIRGQHSLKDVRVNWSPLFLQFLNFVLGQIWNRVFFIQLLNLLFAFTVSSRVNSSNQHF